VSQSDGLGLSAGLKPMCFVAQMSVHDPLGAFNVVRDPLKVGISELSGRALGFPD
jgi:hypothetical protein